MRDKERRGFLSCGIALASLSMWLLKAQRAQSTELKALVDVACSRMLERA